MASIIQIKFGSGANTPTAGALANAELALNVDTGQLWYGSGSGGSSPVTQSEFKFYNVTASSATGSFTGSFSGTFANADVTALKLQSASLLTTTASLIAEDTALKTITASLIAEDTAIKTVTASLIAEDTSLKTKTASLDASIVSFKLETASLHTFTASGFQSPLSMSVGATLSNTTNIAGTPLYVHGKISASDEIEGASLTAATISSSNQMHALTASFGTRTSNTTNTAGTPLYVHGHISASGAVQGGTLVGEIVTPAQPNISSLGALEGLTAGGAIDFTSADEVSIGDAVASTFSSAKNTLTSASVGTTLSNTTNPSGMQLYVHGNASGSGQICFATASFGIRTSNTTNTAGNVIYAHGSISSSEAIFGKDVIVSRQISSSGKVSTATASIGAPSSNTTNIAGTTLYVHGNASASGTVTATGIRLPGAGVISFDDSLDGSDQLISGNDNNIIIDGDDYVKVIIDTEFWVGPASNNALFVVDASGNVTKAGNISASNQINGLTGSFGTAASNTTNIAGTALYAHGNISASGNIIGRQYEQITTNFSRDVGNLTNDFIYMPFAEQSTAENTSKSNLNVNRTCAVPGRPIRTVIRATSDDLGDSTAYTMSAHYMRTGSTAETHMVSVYGSTDGDSNKDAIIFNWADADSGSHDFFMTGDRMLMGIRTTNTATAGYIVTHLWEWDYNLV